MVRQPMARLLTGTLCWALLIGAACGRSSDSTPTASGTAARVAASNSYLEAAVCDLLENRAPVQRLAQPGTCPGHFDIRPSQVNDLRRCRLLLRFDFQASLDAALGKLVADGLKIQAIHIGGGMCEPSSYLSTCQQLADLLVADGLLARTDADRRCAEIAQRVNAKAEACRELIRAAGWTERVVVCSMHQEAFCQWLGLKVAATFTGADSASIGQIEAAIRAGESTQVSVIVANLPEGRRLADALGRRLNAPVVVFGNFPLMEGDEPPFDALIAANVSALVKAATP